MVAGRFPDYCRCMKNKKHFFKTNKAGCVLGAVFLAALTETASYAGGVQVGVSVGLPVVVVAPPVVVAPAVVVEDDYVYYPSYGIYFNRSRHQYAYLQNDAWVMAPAPQGVSVDVLLASPSVNMDWHDSPAHHHADMLKRYPKSWRASDEHHDQKENVRAGAPDGDKRAPDHGSPPNH